MPPKNVSNYNNTQRAKDESNMIPQMRQQIPPQSQPNQSHQHPHQPQAGLHSYSEQTYQRPSNYSHQGQMGSINASNIPNSTSAAISRSSHYTQNAMSPNQVSGQQRIPSGQVYNQQTYNQQTLTYPLDTQRSAMPNKPANVMQTSSHIHSQQPVAPTHMQPRPSNVVPVQQQSHHEGHHEFSSHPQRQQNQMSYLAYPNHPSQQYQQYSGNSSFVQTKSEPQIMSSRSASVPLSTSMPARDPVSLKHMPSASVPCSQLTQDLNVPPSRFVSTYDENTIEQRITGYYSKQSSDFTSLIKLIQDTSADYPCVFSDSLVADLIGASSLSSPSQGHLRVIGLTLQHMVTCVLEKAHELSAATNPDGSSSVLTDTDVENALTVLGFTSLAN